MIKIIVEEETEEKSLGSALIAIATVILTIAMQWLFGRCQRRNQPITEEAQILEVQEESEEEFEIIEGPEDVQTGTTGEN